MNEFFLKTAEGSVQKSVPPAEPMEKNRKNTGISETDIPDAASGGYVLQ
jgi:hypothetical protein